MILGRMSTARPIHRGAAWGRDIVLGSKGEADRPMEQSRLRASRAGSPEEESRVHGAIGGSRDINQARRILGAVGTERRVS